MLIIHVIHTVTSAMTLFHICHGYNGLIDFIERADEAQKVGIVALACAVVIGSSLIVREAFRSK